MLSPKVNDIPNQADEDDGSFSPAVKRKILIACLMALTIGNMMINNVVSFLPTYISTATWQTDDGLPPNSSDISLILAMFSIA